MDIVAIFTSSDFVPMKSVTNSETSLRNVKDGVGF